MASIPVDPSGLPRAARASNASNRTHSIAKPNSAWPVIAAFIIILAFLGGSSRADAVQIAALRPLSALFLVPAIYYFSWQTWRAARLPALLLGLLMGWMAIQLIPLPPGMWEVLPDRDAIAQLGQLIGSQEVWRPISMVPARGLNALASLVVPCAAFALALSLRLSLRDILMLIAGLGIADAVLGMAQLATGETSPLYFYAVTNNGSAVGLFSNENHSAVFSAIVMLAAARLGMDEAWTRELVWLRPFAGVAYALGVIAVIAGGSRAGFVVGMGALALSAIMAYRTVSDRAAKGATQRSSRPRAQQSGAIQGRVLRLRQLVLGNPLKLAIMVLIALIGLAVLFVLNADSETASGALARDAFEDLRWGLVPTLQTMMGAHWLVGSGFGSFEEVYHIYEPTELLMPIYINQAHNDWAQFVIEGGLPGMMVLAGLLVWIGLGLKQIAGHMAGAKSGQRHGARRLLVFWAGVFGAIMVASVPDYPLRAPLFQAVAIWLIVGLALEQAGLETAGQKPQGPAR